MAWANSLAALVLVLLLGGCVFQHGGGNGAVRIGPFDSERSVEIERDVPGVPVLGKRKTPPD